ncbi:zinc finger and BTB domain-containing protein 41-like [Belonocnema kinseyi]|uniref:zinc finger and BTB domain-containing protein 41-like n=1 Tax=Belonocnema kinseyi TaxID=2817044 RepID=UPI00143D756B|nr:zinc finger and BTB domain-containing protein 41-like [Belonocnema kinseyi]
MYNNLSLGKSKRHSIKTEIRSAGKYQAYSLKHDRDDHNLLPKSSEKDATCEIEYINVESVEIKEEIIEDYGNCSKSDLKPTDNHEGQSKIVEMYQSKRKPKNQDSKKELENKSKCEKCARRYRNKKDLISHQKYECDVIPQFKCKFCDKRFKRKTNLWRHTDIVHQKTSSNKTLSTRLKCDKCSRSYTTKSALNRHKRVQHEGITRQFTCDDCGYETRDKVNLYRHIKASHLN